MERENQNLPPIKNQKEAFNLIKKYEDEGCLVFTRPEELISSSLFNAETVLIRSGPDDYHPISGKFMPKRHQKDRIAEAAGITFIEENCGYRIEQEEGHTVYVGWAQAKKRWPDGTWRKSSVCIYGFDPVKRAEEDILRDSKKPPNKRKYPDEVEKKLLLLTYQKFGLRRANTGARLVAIGELTGMPTSFEPNQIGRSMVFSRVAVNTEKLLQDPEMRKEAIRMATGSAQEIYGDNYEVQEEKQLENHTEQKQSTEETTAKEEMDEGEVPWEKPETEEERKNREILEELKAIRKKYDSKMPADGKAIIDDILKQEKPDPKNVDAALDRANDWVDRYLAKKGGQS